MDPQWREVLESHLDLFMSRLDISPKFLAYLVRNRLLTLQDQEEFLEVYNYPQNLYAF